MSRGTLNQEATGRYATWPAGTRVKVTPVGACEAFIEREQPTRGEGKMMPLLDQMDRVPLDRITLDEDANGGVGDPRKEGR